MPEYRNSITLGNVLQMGAFVVALSVAWATLDARSLAAQRTVDDHEVRIRALEAQILGTLGRLDERLARIEAAASR
ncbi:hypothetical protein [Cereibacter johrii]|uniref:hypothetical protein n=1 Tax=Cereibacter johrii TaxID=445629 RepID=UPI000DCD2F08|nr:hypothetical protein [Cereibacter johrii]RAZ82399.1 hypothetical protein DDV93_19215 [Cereibacter johrii]